MVPGQLFQGISVDDQIMYFCLVKNEYMDGSILNHDNHV